MTMTMMKQIVQPVGNHPGRSSLQRQARNSVTPQTVPSLVHDVLRLPGRPLEAATRTFMEPRFGCDFGRVRIHADARAAESARAVNALAYTVGRDVVFGSGQYAPQTGAGRRLLAHELAHVVQQGQVEVPGTIGIDTTHEQAAEAAATAVVAGGPGFAIGAAARPGLARQAAGYDAARQQVLDELGRSMPVAILGMIDGLDEATRQKLAADPAIIEAIAKLPVRVREMIGVHLSLGPRLDSKDREVMDRASQQAIQMMTDALSPLNDLRAAVATRAALTDPVLANALQAVQAWLHVDLAADGQARFLSVLDRAIDLTYKNLAVQATSVRQQQYSAPCDRGHYADSYVSDPSRPIYCCDQFFTSGPQCRRNVIAHERFHLVGLHHGEAGAKKLKAITTPEQALDSAHNLVGIASDVMGQIADACPKD
jgi:hypothetical protein